MDAGVWSAANLVSEWSDVQERLDLTLGVVREDESHGNAAKISPESMQRAGTYVCILECSKALP